MFWSIKQTPANYHELENSSWKITIVQSYWFIIYYVVSANLPIIFFMLCVTFCTNENVNTNGVYLLLLSFVWIWHWRPINRGMILQKGHTFDSRISEQTLVSVLVDKVTCLMLLFSLCYYFKHIQNVCLKLPQSLLLDFLTHWQLSWNKRLPYNLAIIYLATRTSLKPGRTQVLRKGK